MTFFIFREKRKREKKKGTRQTGRLRQTQIDQTQDRQTRCYSCGLEFFILDSMVPARKMIRDEVRSVEGGEGERR